MLLVRVLASLLVLLTGGLGVFFGISYLRLARGYEVKGVPYMGMSSAFGTNELYADPSINEQGRGSAGASLLMVGGYWRLRDQSQPLLHPVEVKDKGLRIENPGSLTEIALVAKQYGLKAKIARAYFGVWSLGSSSSAQRPTPIIVEQSISRESPEEGQIFRVVVGMSPGAKEIYVHDYAFGQFQAMPRSEFLALWKKPRAFLVIEPADRTVTDTAQPAFQYEPRPLNADERDFYQNWYLGELARFARDKEKAVGYFERVAESSVFATQPVGHQMYLLNALLFLYLDLQRFADMRALEPTVLRAAAEERVNWVGLSPATDKAMAWSLLGEAYLGIGDKAKARFYAERALAELPDYYGATQLLEKL